MIAYGSHKHSGREIGKRILGVFPSLAVRDWIGDLSEIRWMGMYDVLEGAVPEKNNGDSSNQSTKKLRGTGSREYYP